MTPEAFQIFTAVVREKLKLVGYKTLSQADDISKARFLISGIILKVKFNTRIVIGGSRVVSEATYNVKWEVYNQQKRKIKYSEKTSSNATSDTGEDPLIIAFRESFREFLASDGLVDSIEKHLTIQTKR